jgi:hypothetical protein
MQRLGVVVTAVLLLFGCQHRAATPVDAGASVAPVSEAPVEKVAPADAGVVAADGGKTASTSTKTAAPKRGEPCPGKVCAEGLTCLEYFGIAGPAGGAFTSCERPCERPCQGKARKCPPGEECVAIADGPGEVCQPR